MKNKLVEAGYWQRLKSRVQKLKHDLQPKEQPTRDPEDSYLYHQKLKFNPKDFGSRYDIDVPEPLDRFSVKGDVFKNDPPIHMSHAQWQTDLARKEKQAQNVAHSRKEAPPTDFAKIILSPEEYAKGNQWLNVDTGIGAQPQVNIQTPVPTIKKQPLSSRQSYLKNKGDISKIESNNLQYTGKNLQESFMFKKQFLLTEDDYLRYFLEKMEKAQDDQGEEDSENDDHEDHLQDLEDDMLLPKHCKHSDHRVDPTIKGKPVLLGWEDY